MYRVFFKLVLRHLPAEAAHSMALVALRVAGKIAPLAAWVRRSATPADALRTEALGLKFTSPLGVAGGMDKNAQAFNDFEMLGFGFVEVGTATSSKQLGNESARWNRPHTWRRRRVWRSVGDEAILNFMGFPNDGAVKIAARIRAGRRPSTVVAASIGKLKDATDANADYRESASVLAPEVDFLIINVSSPNTRGLRDLQSVELLRQIVKAVRGGMSASGAQPPLLVKLSPDLSDEEIDEIVDLALELELDGIIATNTTRSRESLRHVDWGEKEGGVSGRPLASRSLEVLERVHKRTQGRVVLVSVGGISSPEEAWRRIVSGATLLQAHTGFVYGGPRWPREINRGLVRIANDHGFSRIQDAVGTAGRIDEGEAIATSMNGDRTRKQAPRGRSQRRAAGSSAA